MLPTEDNAIKTFEPSQLVVVNTFNISIREADARRSLRVLGQAGLQSKLQDSQGYTEKPCTKEKQKQTNRKKNIKEQQQKKKHLNL